MLSDILEQIPDIDRWSHPDKIKLFGWYLHVHKAQRRFSTADLRTCYDAVHLQDPESFAPAFKTLERPPKSLLRDGEGYYLERRAIEDHTKRYGGPSPTRPISALLAALPTRVHDAAERRFIEEAIACIKADAPRAAIVLGWCAVIDRMRRKVVDVGLDKFNSASNRLKGQTTGRFKHWIKGIQLASEGDLLAVFDADLMIVLQGMGLIDKNQADRLETLFQWRCQSAHPADTPINDAHVNAFFSDAVDIVLANKAFDLAGAPATAG